MSPNVQVGTREQCGPGIPKAVAHKTTTPSRRQPTPVIPQGLFKVAVGGPFAPNRHSRRPKSSFPRKRESSTSLFIKGLWIPAFAGKTVLTLKRPRSFPRKRESSNPPTSKHPVHPVHRCKKTPPSFPRKNSLPRARHGVTPYLIRGGNPEGNDSMPRLPPAPQRPLEPLRHSPQRTLTPVQIVGD